MMELRYPLFDGERVWEAASVRAENGVITAVTALSAGEVDTGYFLMPGLIDAHTHVSASEQIAAMLRSGITATCDVGASAELIRSSGKLNIVSSAGMAMGLVVNGKSYVERAIAGGAKYIKVLLFDRNTIGKRALRSITDAAHERGLKVAVHATALTTVQLAVDCGADILLHVPMKEVLPEGLAKTIAEKEIAVAPTLVMMETFANSGRNGYGKNDYSNASDAVRLLHRCGATILAATDANEGSFAPAVAYGVSLHRELELLTQAGLSTTDVLKAVTNKNAAAFGIEGSGHIAPGQSATMVLVEGRPDKNISDSVKVKQVWVKGEPIM